MVFLHANGYPPECYLPLLSALAAEHRVLAMHQRPLWAGSRPEAVDSWHPLTDDLLRFLDERGADKCIAVGHSMGATVALRAAMRAPDRFEGLVLLDPVLVRRHTMAVWRLFRTLGAGHRLHGKIAGASRRRRSFESREEAFRGYRQRGVFRFISDDALRALIAGLTAPTASGDFVLKYSPEWESRMYHTAIWNDSDLWDGMPGLSVPALIVRGAESDTLSDAACRAARRSNALIQIATIEQASHVVPLERPSAVHESIREFLRNVAAGSGRGVSAAAGKAPAWLHD
jgi:pimeloyl-ACP methyl ester carboxylesterase